jgi:putative transposase
MRPLRQGTPIRDLATYGHSRAVRLDDLDYASDAEIHVVLVADAGSPFADSLVARMICENIEFYCARLQYRLYGYCLMPDHLHTLLSPADSGVALAKWLQSFKSFTTNRFQSGGGGPHLWMRSGRDRVCRSNEAAESVLTYIVNNPVRAGLVDDWRAWPWTKSFIEI